MRDHSPEMYAIQLRVKEIVDALLGLVKSGEITAPDGQRWNAETLERDVWAAVPKLKRGELKVKLHPKLIQTWGFLFGFGKGRYDQSSKYLPRGSEGENLPYTPEKPWLKITPRHLGIIQFTLKYMGFWSGEIILEPSKTPSAVWWEILDSAWRSITSHEPPPPWTPQNTTEPVQQSSSGPHHVRDSTMSLELKPRPAPQNTTDPDQQPSPGSHYMRRSARIDAASRKSIVNFTGREYLLAQLKGVLRPGWITGKARPNKGEEGEREGKNEVPAAVVVLYGLGGIGKTSIAIEFAHANHPPYQHTFFIGADTPDDVERNLAELADFLQIEAFGEEWGSRRKRLVAWLCDNPSWLMIFDNVDSKEAALAARSAIDKMKFERNKERGNIIITARHRKWGQLGYTRITVEEISEKDAVKYLIESTSRVDGIDIDNAKYLARALGCIPSLLDFAAAYIRFDGCTFKQYEKIWKSTYKVVAEWEERYCRSVNLDNSQIRIAASWQTSFVKLSAEARCLLDQLAWLAPEPIPEKLTRGQRSRRFALAELKAYSFVKPLEDGTAFTINPALQQISRAKMQIDDNFGSLVEITKTLAAVFEEDRKAFVPHVLSVLHFLHDDRFRNLEESSLIDSMGSLVVSALFQAEADRIPLQYLPTVLGDFYEVEPLYKPIELLMSKGTWPDTERQLLAANNYVLRYAMAEVLADNKDVSEIEHRLSESVGLNEFEYAGYALALKYAREPASIDSKYIEMLANRDAYCGRSILGDLFINMVFRADSADCKRPRDIMVNERFWGSTWDFIKLDVHAVEAAELFMAGKKVEDPDVQARVDLLNDVRGRVNRALESFSEDSKIASLLRDYFSLGESPSDVRNAIDEIEALNSEIRRELIWILFSHPIWSVAEAAATVLSDLIAQGRIGRDDGFSLIDDLLNCEANWRVQFGANEAAFAVRNIEKEFFYRSVSKCYTHWNCKIVGLCAENLVAHMLNLSAKAREALFSVRQGECVGRFGAQFASWVKHQDCWVLEHVHRFFHTLYIRGANPDECIPKHVSKLLEGIDRWHALDREEFLRRIDRD